jgi:hypothetical protein
MSVKKNSSRNLLLWVALAFALQAAVWTAWLVFAARNRAADVPRATAPARH